MQLLASRYPDSFIGISVHQGNDPMLNKPYADWLLNAGYVTVYPSSTVNRVAMDVDPYDDVLLGGLYEAALSQTVQATVSADVAYADCYNAINVNATARFALSTTDADRYRFAFVIKENGVHQPGDSRYDQANYYSNATYGEFYGWEKYSGPVPADEMYYDDVARTDDFFLGIEHSLPQAVVSQQDYNFTFTLPIPQSVTCGDSIVLVAMIIDSKTSHILNATEIPAADFSRAPDVPLFYEGFRYGMPPGFARYDVDLQQPFSSIPLAIGQAWGVKTSDDGNNFAYSTSYYSPSGLADDWLVTTPIVIPADANYALTWRASSSSSRYLESYELLISTKGNHVSDFPEPLLRVNDESPQWTNHLAVISLHAADTLYIAFRNVTNNGEMLFLDDITLDKTDLTAIHDHSAPSLRTLRCQRSPSPASYDLQGRRLCPNSPNKRLYIIKNNGKTYKTCKR